MTYMTIKNRRGEHFCHVMSEYNFRKYKVLGVFLHLRQKKKMHFEPHSLNSCLAVAILSFLKYSVSLFCENFFHSIEDGGKKSELLHAKVLHLFASCQTFPSGTSLAHKTFTFPLNIWTSELALSSPATFSCSSRFKKNIKKPQSV